MKYSKHQIDKAGVALIGDDPFAREQALSVIADWRMTFIPVLEEFCSKITDVFEKENIKFAFYSKRIKRMTSIEEKLSVNKENRMKLGGLQDIGGARFVFENVQELLVVQKLLEVFVPEQFEKKKTYDYVENPKKSGYRSIHYVYKYHSNNEDYDGLQIELQIRTRLQHSWAMAVETASLISRTSLKQALDDKSEWREFFELVSAIFAQKEECPVNEKYKDFTNKDYCDKYIRLLNEHKFLEQLKALRVTMQDDTIFETTKKGHCVLSIDFEKRLVHAKLFDEADNASDVFTKIERSLLQTQAVVMVSIEKMNEIREAYPSYFLDTSEFIKSLEDFNSNCKTKYYY